MKGRRKVRNGRPGSERGMDAKRAETAGKYVIDGQEVNGERLRNEQKPLGSERGTARKRTGNGCEASRNGRKRRSWTGSGQETDEKCNFKQYEP